MIHNTFTPALYEVILQQRQDSCICPNCGYTQIEHVFERDKTCGYYAGPTVPDRTA